MSKTSKELYKDFNKNAKMFIRELMKVYKDNTVLKLLHAAYKVMKTFNRKLPQRYFHEYVMAPYGKYIYARDDSFIYAPDFQSDAIPGIDKFVQLEWPRLDDINKKKIWEYLQVLAVMNKRCLDYQQSTGEVVREDEKDPDSDNDD